MAGAAPCDAAIRHLPSPFNSFPIPSHFPPPSCMPSLYRLIHKAAFVNLLLRPAVPVACPMTTVSGLIEDFGIK